MGNASGKNEYSGYDSYDESELSDEESIDSLRIPIEKKEDEKVDYGDKREKNYEEEEKKDYEEENYEDKENIDDLIQRILDDRHRVVNEIFDEMERFFLKKEEDEGYEEEDEGYEEEDEGYEEEDQQMICQIVSLFSTELPLDLL